MVHLDVVSQISERPAQESRVDQLKHAGERRVELHHEHAVRGAGERVLQRRRADHGEVGGNGFTDNVYVAGCIQVHGLRVVLASASQIAEVIQGEVVSGVEHHDEDRVRSSIQVGAGVGVGRGDQIAGLGAPNHIEQAIRVDLHRVDLVGRPSAPKAGIDQIRIDNQRLGMVVGANRQPHRAIRQLHVAPIDLAAGSGARVALVEERPLLDQLAAGAFHNQVALRSDAGPVRTLEPHTDSGWIRARLDQKVVLQPAVFAIVDYVDAGVHIAIADPRVIRNAGAPPFLGSHEIAGRDRRSIERFDLRGPVGAIKRKIHPATASKGERRPRRGKQHGVLPGVRGITHGRIPLALVGFEMQRRTRHRGLSLWRGDVARRRPGQQGNRGSKQGNAKRTHEYPQIDL